MFQEVDYDLIVVVRPGMGNDELRSYAHPIRDLLTARGLEIHNTTCVEADKSSVLVKNENPRIICSIGGDGTFATACRVFARDTSDVVIGFQYGSLNFLNAFTFEEGVTLGGICDASNKLSVRTLGYARAPVPYRGKGELNFTNDVVLQPAEDFTMGVYEIRDGRGRYVSSFRSDGVIIATAMGSTAYNLSAGGPILHPTMESYIITPKCATHIGSRPIVLPMHLGLEITATSDVNVLQDGVFAGTTTPEQGPVCFGRGSQISVLLPDSYSFFEQAREKLGWFK